MALQGRASSGSWPPLVLGILPSTFYLAQNLKIWNIPKAVINYLPNLLTSNVKACQYDFLSIYTKYSTIHQCIRFVAYIDVYHIQYWSVYVFPLNCSADKNFRKSETFSVNMKIHKSRRQKLKPIFCWAQGWHQAPSETKNESKSKHKETVRLVLVLILCHLLSRRILLKVALPLQKDLFFW